MAKKKEELVSHDDLGTDMNVSTASLIGTEVFIDEIDFNELLELEQLFRQTEGQFDKIAGTAARLKKDLEIVYNNERALNNQMENKRAELVKRYRIDGKRSWVIEIGTRKVVYK